MMPDEICDPVHHDKGTVPGEGRQMLVKFLDAAVRYQASDLIAKVDLPPRIRLRGSLKSLQTDECSEQLMFQIAKDVLDEEQYAYFHDHGAIDFTYDYDEDNRFRVSLFMSRGKPSLAARLITSNVKTFEGLHLKPILGDLAMSAHQSASGACRVRVDPSPGRPGGNPQS